MQEFLSQNVISRIQKKIDCSFYLIIEIYIRSKYILSNNLPFVEFSVDSNTPLEIFNYITANNI